MMDAAPKYVCRKCNVKFPHYKTHHWIESIYKEVEDGLAYELPLLSVCGPVERISWLERLINWIKERILRI